MKFLHLADLHLGKTIHSVNLIDSGDQPAWVDRFLALAAEVRPQAVVIAGDVYDRSAPSGEAVTLFSRLLTGLNDLGIEVVICSGNHDSGQRLAFAAPLLHRQKVHISGVLGPGGRMDRVTLPDEHGPVHFTLMPYVFPALAAEKLGEKAFPSYDAAVRALISAQQIDASERNVIVAHQNVTQNGLEAERGGSESMVGGLGQVDYTAFDAFDYAALGHIHSAYHVGREAVRYAGSPLCYHFNETHQRAKGPVLVELGAKGQAPEITTLTIPPLHPLREARGPLEVLKRNEAEEAAPGEYIRVVLTDHRQTPEIREYFDALYRNRGARLLEMTTVYRPERIIGPAQDVKALETKSLETLFAEHWQESHSSSALTEVQLAILRKAGELTRRTNTKDRKVTDAQAAELLKALKEVRA